MDFLGIGPLELVFILLIVFIVMGPSDVVKTASTLGRTLRNLRQSEIWTAMQRAQKEIRSLPDTLARQVELDDLKDIKKSIEKDLSSQAKEIKDIDNELVAWTRTGGQKPETPKPSEEKKEETEKPESES